MRVIQLSNRTDAIRAIFSGENLEDSHISRGISNELLDNATISISDFSERA